MIKACVQQERTHTHACTHTHARTRAHTYAETRTHTHASTRALGHVPFMAPRPQPPMPLRVCEHQEQKDLGRGAFVKKITQG